MAKYRGEWCICIGFDGSALKEITPVVERLKEKYPDQHYSIGNSRFPQYTFILFCRAKTRDEAHRIGMALTQKHLPGNLSYWIKEIKK